MHLVASSKENLCKVPIAKNLKYTVKCHLLCMYADYTLQQYHFLSLTQWAVCFFAFPLLDVDTQAQIWTWCYCELSQK